MRTFFILNISLVDYYFKAQYTIKLILLLLWIIFFSWHKWCLPHPLPFRFSIFDLVKVFLNFKAITPGRNLSRYVTVVRIAIFKEPKLRLMNTYASVISAEFSYFQFRNVINMYLASVLLISKCFITCTFMWFY